MAGGLKAGDIQAWADEGFETAKAKTYPASLHEKQTPDPTYKKMVFAAADQAIALAGYRLADLLEGMLTGQTPPPPPTPQTILHPTGLPAPSHIVIVIEENKDFGDVIGAPKAKYINELAGRGALLTSFFASHHPSQPNYIELFAGDRLGVCKDECPIGPFTAQNLAAALIAAGKTFAGFAEDLPPSDAREACHDPSFPLFAPKHCPWVDFSNIPASASMDFSEFPQDPAGFAALPDVSFVIPNLKNDMHNGAVTSTEVGHGDRWLKAKMSNYADWAEENNSLLIVTWDEDSVHANVRCPAGLTTIPPRNRIPTLIMGEPVMAGTQSATTHTHADLLRTILDIYGIAPFGNATTATDITGIWK
jgi:acid phosphatase